MKNPITEYKRMFRVIGGHFPELIGKEFGLQIDDLAEDVVSLEREDGNYRSFKKSDVQELTPLSFNNRRIAIGDEVKWNGYWSMVYGYTWFDGEWLIQTVQDWEHDCCELSKEQIKDHRTPQDNKVDLSDDELLAEVRKRGLI